MGRSRPQLAIPGQAIAAEELEILDALDLANNASTVDPKSQFAGRIVIVGSSAEQLGDLHRTSIGVMPGMMVIANAIRSALETGPVSSSGLWLGLVATPLLSLATYFLWLLIRQIRGVGHLVFKEGAAPLINILWLFLISVWLPSPQMVEILFPQIILTLYLVVVAGLREARHVA